MAALMNTYGQRALTLVKGQGSRVWDDAGREYLDAVCGIAVCGLGHAHPAVTKAISEQAGTLLHVSNLFNIPPQQQLGEKLCAIAGMEQVFFSNSGAEANEAAIKIARKYGNDRGIDKPIVLVTHQSFHGRTMATLSATGNPKVQAGFAPLLEGFVHIDYDDLDAVKAAAATHPNIVAVLVEPVQGEGGVNMPANDYLNRLRDLCDANEWLLMLDEIQTGNGRTGTHFAFQHNGITPDVMTTAKGLGNGVPIGACLVSGRAVDVLQPGNHGSTFGGNPLACAAALAVIDTLDQEQLLDRVQSLGDRLLTGFRSALADCEHVAEIRGMGLLIGIELDHDCGELVDQAREAGLLINVTAGKVVRLLPPFVLSDDEADTLVEKVSALIKALH